MVTSNFNWVLDDLVTITNSQTFTTPPIPPVPAPPNPASEILALKVKSIDALIREEKAYLNKKRGRPDPYSDPDIFI